MRYLTLSTVLLVWLLGTSVKADNVYKCLTPEGRKVFSGLPCGPDAILEEYRVRQPARKTTEDYPPRQGELLNDTPAAVSGVSETQEKSPE